jgi:hypothetical protein
LAYYAADMVTVAADDVPAAVVDRLTAATDEAVRTVRAARWAQSFCVDCDHDWGVHSTSGGCMLSSCGCTEPGRPNLRNVAGGA